ncbi:crotonase/enoyl-CoA hydratase family protein [Stappia taiwanensis]|uniref:Crotonase/enoyl-CoA hydratase family protein n=1 Tax=Stappia taiwanensis TaxID=992267 RepID=A0A838XNZ7_9HYPH|nr:crotonase/enoyl-CoA hydratase family protein [Stappia taiwanensis]MBA4612215.1 crotonase/enoyl-CoA hydratase family protein [Stappia taiwanensis]GGE92686.1 enoyl-CoA hydratase [Stappia taiwanensis]
MIEIETAGGVQVLRLNRPAKKNALTGEMYTALSEALERGNDDPDIRAHLLCGVPGAFTAGNDIADFLQYAMGDGGMADAPVVRFLRALARCETPLVAAVDGLAIGVGTTLLFHCDMVYASPRALFKTPFLDLGLVPEAGASLLAPQRMGHGRAFELLCLGEGFDPVRAKAAGLVNHIVAEEAIELEALQCAKAIAAKPAEAMALSRRLLIGDRTVLHTRMKEEIELFAQRLRSEEAKAAFTAFMARSQARD